MAAVSTATPILIVDNQQKTTSGEMVSEIWKDSLPMKLADSWSLSK